MILFTARFIVRPNTTSCFRISLADLPFTIISQTKWMERNIVGDRRRNFDLRPKPKHSAKNRRLRPKSSAEVFHIKKVEFWVCRAKIFFATCSFQSFRIIHFFRIGRKGICLLWKNNWIKFFFWNFSKIWFFVNKNSQNLRPKIWEKPKVASAEAFGRGLRPNLRFSSASVAH